MAFIIPASKINVLDYPYLNASTGFLLAAFLFSPLNPLKGIAVKLRDKMVKMYLILNKV